MIPWNTAGLTRRRSVWILDTGSTSWRPLLTLFPAKCMVDRKAPTDDPGVLISARLLCNPGGLHRERAPA